MKNCNFSENVMINNLNLNDIQIKTLMKTKKKVVGSHQKLKRCLFCFVQK